MEYSFNGELPVLMILCHVPAGMINDLCGVHLGQDCKTENGEEHFCTGYHLELRAKSKLYQQHRKQESSVLYADVPVHL